MIIDIHAHADGEYGSVDSIKERAAAYHLEKIVLCTSPKNIHNQQKPPKLPLKQTPDSIYTMNRMLRMAYTHFIKGDGDGNRTVYELTKQLPGLAVQFLWVNPLDKGQMNDLENRIALYQPKGIKLHQAWNDFTVDGAEFQNLVDIASSHRLPVFIHLYSKKEVVKLTRFIRENPAATFIIGHLTGVGLFQQSGVPLKNVYFDTSSSSRIQAGDIRQAIDAFGYEHIVFGTDTPYADIDEQISKIEQLKLPDRIKEHIYCLNAKRILAMDV